MYFMMSMEVAMEAMQRLFQATADLLKLFQKVSIFVLTVSSLASITPKNLQYPYQIMLN